MLTDDIQKTLTEAGVLEKFQALPPSHQREYLKWINEAKKPATRVSRINKMCAMIKNST